MMQTTKPPKTMWSGIAPPPEQIGPADCPIPVIADAITNHMRLWSEFRKAIADVQECERYVRDESATDLKLGAEAMIAGDELPTPQAPIAQARLLDAKRRRAAAREALNTSAEHIENLVFDHQTELADWARSELDAARDQALDAATQFAGAVPTVARAEAVLRWVESPNRFSVAAPTVRRGNEQIRVDAAISELVDRLAPAPHPQGR
jgi:hypothetical protein